MTIRYKDTLFTGKELDEAVQKAREDEWNYFDKLLTMTSGRNQISQEAASAVTEYRWFLKQRLREAKR